LGLAVALVAVPYLILIVPVFLVFHLPIYLPFLLSFTIKAHKWRGLRWSLRIGSAVAFVIRQSAMSQRPDFGGDVAGNIAGASHNFEWTWGSGAACALVAVIIGVLLRLIQTKRI
jgi:hypothetical protein